MPISFAGIVQKTSRPGFLVNYLSCDKCEIITFGNCEIFCCAESEMKQIHSYPQVFHIAKQYFAAKGNFTNPTGIYFVKKTTC